MRTTQATDTKQLDYPYILNGKTSYLHFKESNPGMIDPERYSLREILHDKRLDHLTFKQRQ